MAYMKINNYYNYTFYQFIGLKLVKYEGQHQNKRYR